MEPPFARLLRLLGLAEVLIGDEFGDEAHRVSAEELSGPESWSRAQPRRVVAVDQSLLALTPWDSFFTIIVGTSDLLREALPDMFEGFWCADQTTTDWCFEPLIPLAGWSTLP
jgi:hypothetical protein